ncbi:diguanylate cyclase [Vibrio sp. OCN044]|uniref:diguanylate cyclase n=1 Tax=Vibrio tetraodonis subsp. pristinus TaxID=2695891 RepID=A0A6L8LZ18_9VIBR|nr:diguanylate cyclase [Vibrio tetraodonis]MYM61371.1 diguanylate cyclase [Vibrio tetraodonis subsp. pristinus]
MSNTSFGRLQYFPIIALTLSMIVGGYYYDRILDNWLTNIVSNYMSNLVDDVDHQIHQRGLVLEDMDQSEIDNFLDNLSQAKVEQRFSIIDSQGRVLGDSQLTHKQVLKLEDHSLRPEVVSAFSTGWGQSKRFSASMNQELLYIAKRLTLSGEADTGEEYVLRLSMPMTALYAMSSDLKLIEHLLMLLSLVILVLSTWVSHRKIFNSVKAEQDLQEYRIQKSTKEIEQLHQLANMLAACSNLKEAQMVVSDIIPRLLGPINGCVAVMKESRNQLEVSLDWGGTWPADKVYGTNECWALRKGRYHLSKDESHQLSCPHMACCQNDLTLCIPLTAHGNTVGMFHLYLDSSADTLSEERKQLAFTIAEHLGLALANLSLQDKLRSQAMRDPLTGLYNRRYFEETFEKAWLNASQRDGDMSLLMLDLDHFKRFNDNYGHDAGDYVLKEVASLLTHQIGEHNTACRLGGEELAIICPRCSVEPAMTLANQIVEAVGSLHLSMQGISLGQLGVSIGVATYPDLPSSPAELIKAADIALYEAKNNGRNQAIHEREAVGTSLSIVPDVEHQKTRVHEEP